MTHIKTPTSFLKASICCSLGLDTFNFFTATGPIIKYFMIYFALIKEDALNNKVCLTTRLYCI